MRSENSNDAKEENIKDFDDILRCVGGWGPFQYLLTVIFFPFNMFLGYVYLSPILVLFTPPHWCMVEELVNLTRKERMLLAIPRDSEVDGGFSQCEQYVVDWQQIVEQNIQTADPAWPVGKCESGWEYDLEDFHTSITVQFDWVCEENWIPALSQTVLFFGAIPGMLFFGWFSDAYGRLPTIMISNIIALLAGICTPFATGYVSFLACRFVMGLSFNTFFTAPYILVLEYVDISKRTLVGNLGLALFLALSGVIQPWAIKSLGDWRLFHWAMFSQMGLIVFLPFILPESGRWLMAKGKGEKLITVLKRIAKMNKKKVPEGMYKTVVKMCKEQELVNLTKSNLSYIDLISNKKIRKYSILVIFLWMITSLVLDTTIRNISNLNINIYTSFMVTTALELPANLLSIVGLNWIGRRWSSAISLSVCGTTMLCCALLTGHLEAQLVMFMVGRFTATYAINAGRMIVAEVMPTELRCQGVSLANVLSMGAMMASPYIVYSSVLSKTAPFWIIGILAILGTFPGLLLPETVGIKLPDSVDEMEYFGRHDRFFWIPLFGSSTRYKKQKVEAENIGAQHISQVYEPDH